jgi:segregation and condensation protein B
MENLEAVIEALVFVSEEPLTLKKLREILDNVEETEIRDALYALGRSYEARQGGLYLADVAGGYQLRTREACAGWIKKLHGMRPVTISKAAMETLAVIAYRQPVMKAEIEKVRGVDVSGTLKGLLEKNLIRIVGRKDVPGKPIIYGTTKKFLEVFNLKDLSELPTMNELKDLEGQS